MSSYTYKTSAGPGGNDGNYFSPVAINGAGVIAGNVFAGMSGTGFVYDPSTNAYTLLSGPDGNDSVTLTGINDHSQVAGSYVTSDNITGGAFIYNETTHSYTTFSGPDAVGVDQDIQTGAMNNPGQVLINYYTTGPVAAVYDSKTSAYTVLAGPDSGGDTVQANAINDIGEIVGAYHGNDNVTKGFIYNTSTGLYSTLSGPSGTTSVDATAINASGEVAGNINFGQLSEGFFYDPSTGSYTILTGVDGSGIDNYFSINGIDNAGDVTGSYYNGSTTIGFVYDTSTSSYTILTGPDSSVDQYVTPFAMNGAGQVAGTFYNPDNSGVLFVADPACYCAGTMIATPDGAALVETLSIGDLITTADGDTQSVRWIGRNTVSTRFADPLRVLPIRIKRAALGDNLPTRDLLLSADHAILVDDILIQAGALVNGVSIVRERNVPECFTYYHVELACHALLLAEGVPAETFVDNVSRMGFDNWEEHEALYGPAPITEMAYPRAQSARQVPIEIAARLTARFDGTTALAA